jgi:hypothetical protein
MNEKSYLKKQSVHTAAEATTTATQELYKQQPVAPPSEI